MYKEKIINLITGEETWRDYTPQEIEEVEKAKVQSAKKVADLEAKEQAKQSARNKLIDLGLTEDEIAAL